MPSVERLIREFVYEAVTAQNLVVVKTSAGSAQPVSAAIDAEEWDEVVGTIGGDDTILVIAPDAKQAEKVAARIRGYFVSRADLRSALSGITGAESRRVDKGPSHS